VTRLAQQQPVPRSGDHQVQELLHLAAAVEAERDTAEAVRLWQQILAFAGANQPDANPSDDGYLTAAEATAMDLEGTELVTLSACETGLGGVQSGEGVYGLQRSLAVAGARSTLLSLWKVDDYLTITFMERYYNRLKTGQGRADALRDTQKEFRGDKNSKHHDIRVWGAFQLSGDWRALPKW
jgi:CHAT domain-containing protein